MGGALGVRERARRGQHVLVQRPSRGPARPRPPRAARRPCPRRGHGAGALRRARGRGQRRQPGGRARPAAVRWAAGWTRRRTARRRSRPARGCRTTSCSWTARCRGSTATRRRGASARSEGAAPPHVRDRPDRDRDEAATASAAWPPAWTTTCRSRCGPQDLEAVLRRWGGGRARAEVVAEPPSPRRGDAGRSIPSCSATCAPSRRSGFLIEAIDRFLSETPARIAVLHEAVGQGRRGLLQPPGPQPARQRRHPGRAAPHEAGGAPRGARAARARATSRRRSCSPWSSSSRPCGRRCSRSARRRCAPRPPPRREPTTARPEIINPRRGYQATPRGPVSLVGSLKSLTRASLCRSPV